MFTTQKERTLIIIALNDLDFNNDLLEFNDSFKHFNFKSKQTLHALTNVS